MPSLIKERKARAQLEQSLLSPKASAVAAQYKGKVWSFQPGMGRLVDELQQALMRNPVRCMRPAPLGSHALPAER